MTDTVRRRARWQRAGPALLIAGLLTGAAAGTTAAAGTATATTLPAVNPATLTLWTVTPTAPQDTDTLRLTGQLTNQTVLPLEHLSLQLYLNPSHFYTRGEFDAYAQEPVSTDFGTDGLTQVSTATASLPRTTLPAGASESWSVSVPMASIAPQLQPWEVYRLGVAVTSSDTTVARLRTFLPYAPVSEAQGRNPLSVAWLWPLADRPHRNAIGTTDQFTDDQLATEVRSGGRLASLLAAAQAAARQHPPGHRPDPRNDRNRTTAATQPALPRQPVPVTLAVDPMLLSELHRMTSGYTVHAGGKSHPGTGRAAATTFLGQLKSLLGSATVGETLLPLPYADPDLVAALRAHQGQQLATATSLATSVVSQVLGNQGGRVLSQWAWPDAGYADTSTIDWLFTQGFQNVILDAGAMPPVTPPGYTPSAHVTVASRDKNLTGLLADSTLSQVVGDGATADSGLALQRYLSETLMIEAQQPSTPGRSILVAPPRHWAPRPGYASQLLSDTGRVPWLQPTTLPAAAQAAEAPKGLARTISYPYSQRRQELPQHYLMSVRAQTGKVNRLGAILPAGTQLVRADDEAILQAMSSAWRGQPIAAAEYRDALARQVAHMMGQVRIATAGNSLITLTSHSGAVPITIFNGLDQPARVGIRLLTGHRLSISGGNDTHAIPPHQRISVDVRATANVSGTFAVTARLLTPGPHAQPYGRQLVHLVVRSTAYGTAALAITAAACAVLFGAVGFRLARRALAARRTAAAG